MCGAGVFTSAASDTLGVVAIFNRVYIHLANPFTLAAANTFVSVQPVSEHGDGIEKGVYCSQGAYILAKRSINYN